MLDTPTKNHTFVRTVKPQDVYFSQVDGVLHDIKTKNSPTWVILSFAVWYSTRYPCCSCC